MSTPADLSLTLLIFITALIYSSVGQAGASGYMAAMALMGVEPAVMKPTALSLSILVASIGSFQFYRAGFFRWSLFWPFAVTSIPASFLGGYLTLPGSYYRPLVGIVLLYAAYRLLSARRTPLGEPRPFRLLPCLLLGAVIGIFSGLTGMGGGIYLTPILLFAGWADPKQAAAVSVMFILVNSIAGLAGVAITATTLPLALPVWAVAAATGGTIGSYYGSRRLSAVNVRRVLGLVLLIAGIKMLLPA